MGSSNTSLNLLPPFQPKTHTVQQIKQGLPVYMVISFFNIKLANHPRNPALQPTIQTLNLLANTLDTNLYTLPTKLIGRKSLMLTALPFLGIIVRNEAFKDRSNTECQ